MKFVTLLKKELREMLSVTTIIGIVVAMVIFFFLGQVMTDVMAESTEEGGTIHLIDEDKSVLSQSCIAVLEQSGFEVVEEQPSDAADETLKYKPQGNYDLLVIPAGFEASINSGKAADVDVYANMNTLAMSGMFAAGTSEAAVALINETVSSQLLTTQLAEGSTADPTFLKNPVNTSDVTFVADKYASVNASMLSSYAMSQSMFVPLVVFILVIFASQMISSAIANEKGDKTLETLLCTPVSRLSVIAAKMCSAAIVSLLMAVVYMIGFSSYMGGMMGGAGDSLSLVLGDSLETLGINLSVMDYVLVGLQLFLTILIALAASLILGSLASDVKAAQTAITPLMFLLLIPYMMSMFIDINSISLPMQILFYAIPFSHTFVANSNMIFDNYVIYFAGLAYQIVFLAVVLFLAVKLFSGDRIFTIRLNISRRRKRNAAPAE